MLSKYQTLLVGGLKIHILWIGIGIIIIIIIIISGSSIIIISIIIIIIWGYCKSREVFCYYL